VAQRAAMKDNSKFESSSDDDHEMRQAARELKKAEGRGK